MPQRDDFSEAVKRALAARVAYLCSNPECRAPTSGPHEEAAKAVNLGVGAHITAAAPGGPRYDAGLTSEQRASAENGIWLCATCAKLIDSDPLRFPVSLLREWKAKAEADAQARLGKTAFAPPQPTAPASYEQNLSGVIAGAVVNGPGGETHGSVTIGQVVAQNLRVEGARQESTVPIQPSEPKLRVVFAGVLGDRFSFSPRPPLPARDVFVATEMEKVRQANPRDGIRMSAALLLEDGTWGEEHVTEPDADLDAFLAKYEAYLGKLHEYRERESRTLSFTVALVNEGRGPADEVDVTLRFPPDVEVWAQDDESRNLKMPEEPQRYEIMAIPKGLLEYQQRNERLRANVAKLFAGPANVSEATFRKTPVGTEVRVSARRIKHDRLHVDVASLCVMFSSRDAMENLEIGYRVFAVNVPDHVEGHLFVIVEKGEAASTT